VCVREALEEYLANIGQTKNIPSEVVQIYGQTGNVPENGKENYRQTGNEDMPQAVNLRQTEKSTPVYDSSKYVLGKLCPRRHEFESTGQSLLRLSNRHCIVCDREKFHERKAGKGAEGVEAQGRRLGVGGLRRGEVMR
jgi:hypothetical protein